MQYLSVPRVEVLMIPLEKTDKISTRALFEVYLVLHVPDGKPPMTIRCNNGPFNQDRAYNILLAAYTTLGEKYAQLGAMGDLMSSSEYDAKIRTPTNVRSPSKSA
jgi:hypothetical protein